MKSRIARDEVNVEVDSGHGPELATILSELRTQYEGIVKKNKEQAEQWYRKKVRRRPTSAGKHYLKVATLNHTASNYSQFLSILLNVLYV